MLDYVETLTRAPWTLGRADVDGLRAAGWTDSEILQIVLGSAHFGYLNRMADGIGIRFEYTSDLPAMPPPEDSPHPFPSPRRGEGMPSAGLLDRPEQDAWIPMGEAPADGAVGEPRNLYRVMAANPEAAALTREWRAFHLSPTPALDAALRARLALYVASLEQCTYGVPGYARVLRQLDAAPAAESPLARGEMPSDLSERERALFTHAERLTRAPAATREEHIEELRGVGLDDVAVLELTMLVSYVSFENRVALGLGVPLEGTR
jgi:uncharacterized peroxidase-related enzyme